MKYIQILKTCISGRSLTVFFSIIIMLCLFTGGCSDGDNDVTERNVIQYQNMLCPDGSYSDAKEQYLTDSMYKLLGMLDEFMGRFSYVTGEPYPDRVELFYSSETDSADYFEDSILKYQAESKKQFNYVRETVSPGRISFSSTDLSTIINSFYIKPDGFTATLDRNTFCRASEGNLLSYVESAYMRYGTKNKNLINMANARYKMATIGLVLKKLGCSNVSIFKSSGGGGGGSLGGSGGAAEYIVLFEPTKLVTDLCGIVQIVTEANMMQSGYVLYERI